jgi:arylsulfatase A
VARSGDWKLIEHYDPPRLELYNLASDPGEKTDLAGQQPHRVAQLRSKLEAWLDSLHTIRHRPNPNFSPGIG